MISPCVANNICVNVGTSTPFQTPLEIVVHFAWLLCWQEDGEQFACFVQQPAASCTAALQAEDAVPVVAAHIAGQPGQLPGQQSGIPALSVTEVHVGAGAPSAADAGSLDDVSYSALQIMDGVQQAELGGMMTQLMTAPLAARYT